MDSPVEHGGTEYWNIMQETEHSLPVIYGPDVEMALADDLNQLGTDWVPVTEVFSNTLDGKPFSATRLLIRIGSVVCFWHSMPVTHNGAPATVTINFPSALWQKAPTLKLWPFSPFIGATYSVPDYGNSGRLLSKALPALNVKVLSPCEHTWPGSLESIIIHLNDTHQWAREQIADWLDTLDLDLTFPVPDTIPSSIH